MRRLISTLLGLGIVGAMVAVPAVVAADGHEPGVTLIAVDLGSTAMSEADAAVAETALRILASSSGSGAVAMMPYSDSAGTPVRYAASSSELSGAVSTLSQRIATRGDAAGSDQFAALASAFSYLSSESAPAGSEVYLITGRMQDGSAQNRERIVGFADLFIAEGWKINAVMLPSAVADARDFITSIVDRAAGRWDDTGTLEGLAGLTHSLLDFEGTPVLDIALQTGATSVQAIEVAPEATRLSVSMVRNSDRAMLDLFDPHGVQLAPTSNAARFITTPNFVVATIDGPEPGTWSLRVTGDGRQVMASIDLKSPLQLELVDQPPVPAGQPALLMAVATVDGQPRWLPGSEVTATVKSPDGSSLVYRLNDDGEGGDTALGDGVYSVVFTASPEQGFNDVELELAWDDYGATVSSADAFRTEVFPAVKITPASGGSIEAGQEIVVGTIEVSVDVYPYPITPDALSAVVTGPTGGSVPGKLRALDALDDGSGWRFEVLATPNESGPQTVTAELNTEYVGRSFVTSGPTAQTPVTVNYPVVLPPASDATEVIVPIAGGVLLALLVGAGVTFYLVNRRQVVPFGYIYDDRGQLLIDLSSVRKSGLNGLFSRGIVTSADAADLPLPGARLVFTRSGPQLHYDNSGNVTMRVDGKPADRVVHLRDGSRIGLSGRLFEFTSTRRRVTQEPAVAPEPAG